MKSGNCGALHMLVLQNLTNIQHRVESFRKYKGEIILKKCHCYRYKKKDPDSYIIQLTLTNQ